MRKPLLIAWMAALLVMPFNLFSQVKQITGKVVSEKGEPVSYASIAFKGGFAGSSAYGTGQFTIIATPKDKALFVSAAGYMTKNLVFTGAPSYTITMTSGANALQEVVKE